MAKSTTLYSNNARTTLATSITASSGTIQVSSAAGFPNIPGPGFEFFVTLDDNVNIEIVKVTGVSGNTLTGCIRGQEGTIARVFNPGTKVENRLTAGNLNSMARLKDRLLDIASIEDMDAPTDTDGNSRLSAATDPFGIPIVAVSNGAKWRLLNYPSVIRVSTVGVGSSLTSLPLVNASAMFNSSVPKMFVIQFTSGANIGQLRFLSVLTDSVSWTTPLIAALNPADTYEVYRSSLATSMPLGGNSDRIFFENDAVIWNDYTIPMNRNASTAGPVSISAGVTVTIPSGSGWTII